TGPRGRTGATGPQGPAGKVELIICKRVTKTVLRTVRHKRRRVRVTVQRCTGRLVAGAVKFTAAGVAARARISRGRAVYATGASVATAHGGTLLVLTRLLALRHGRYTLTLRRRRGRRWTIHHYRITIA
ncbi:MAG: hypothetical protein ACYC0H_15285, partial [Solirubrobacteraceae bacterium]